jgi:2-(1,2-epoxy-1,2-dihydrophenyl)acetyl-CoA isomerase
MLNLSPSLQQTKVHLEGSTAVITLDRPGKMNAFTVQMHKELMSLFEAASKDDVVRCVVLTGKPI